MNYFVAFWRGGNVRLSSIFALTLLLLFGLHNFAHAQASKGPALWKLENQQSTVYLFGSFHMLKEGVNWQSQHVIDALDKATSITLEVGEGDIRPEAMRLLVREHALYIPPQSIDKHLTPEQLKSYFSFVADMGIPLDVIRQFKPWYASTMISVQHAMKNGFYPENGVEAHVLKAAQSMGVSVNGLETALDQILTLSGQSNEVQVEMLLQVMNDVENLSEVYDGLMTAWLTGDEKQMEVLMVDEMKNFPQVFEKIYTERNKNWIPKIVSLLHKEGVHFVTVGAAHLVGEGSVIELLENEGYIIIRQ